MTSGPDGAAEGRVTALISWAHQDAGWTPDQVRERREQVLRLVATLRDRGIDVDVDLFHMNVDWTRWGPQRIRDVDVVLIIVSRGWADAWEGRGDLRRNIGAAAEADVLRSIAAASRDALQDKCRLIVLPDADDTDIPDGLHGIARYRLESLDPAGVEHLIRDLTDQPLYPVPPLGEVPVLPPALTATAETSERTDGRPHGKLLPASPAVSAEGRLDQHASSAASAARREQLSAQLAALPTPQAGEGPWLPWYREWERVQRELAELNALEVRTTPEEQADAPTPAIGAESADEEALGDLPWAPVQGVEVEWHDRRSHDSHYRSYGEYASVYIHLVPTPARRLSARIFAQAASRLPHLLRAHANVSPSEGMDVDDGQSGATVRIEHERRHAFGSAIDRGLSGARLSVNGSSSAWSELPRDTMGAVLDPQRLISDIAECLALAAAALEAAGSDAAQRVAIAAELNPITMITDGTVDQLGSRTSASMRGATARGPIAVDAEESLPLSIVIERRADVAAVVAELLVRAWNQT